MNNSSKVVYNTGVLYIKLIVVVILGLITTRYVLDALGIENYGIYVLVGGVVSMLGILNGAMSNASMRFMAFSLGTGDINKSKITFNTTLYLHLLIGIGLIILMELGGIFMFNSVLIIPEGMMFSAKVVFHFMVATTFVSIISVPYDAIINAHENLLFLSLVDVFGAILKLFVALTLIYSPYDLLITYGFLIFLIQLLQRIIKQVYTRLNYEECEINFSKHKDPTLSKEILSFSLWNLFGSIAGMVVIQIRGLFLNRFYGVHINAADGIANNVSAQVNMVAVSMTRAINPQLTKSEGAGNRDRMLYITTLATKYSIFLFALLAIPLIFELDFILNLWLKEVPDYAIVFCRLILIILFVEKFTFEITNAIRAAGKIKLFQVVETIIMLLAIPAMFTFLSLGYEPEVVFYIFLVLSIIAGTNRLFMGKHIINLNIGSFLKDAVLKVILPLFLTVILGFILNLFLSSGWMRFIIYFLLLPLSLCSFFWIMALGKLEKTKFKDMLRGVLVKFHQR